MSRALGVTFGWIRIHEARVKSILRVSRGGFMVIQMNKLKRMSVIGALISLFVIFGAPGTTGQKEANPREGMRNEEWEYLAVAGPGPATLSVDPHMRKEPNVSFGREAFALEQHLDKLGENGWELVAVAGPPTDPAYYFKRRK
jgi:hypothetical protein